MTKRDFDKARRRDSIRRDMTPHQRVQANGHRVDELGYIEMTSKFDSRCGTCDGPIRIRARIWWHPTHKHTACRKNCRLAIPAPTFASQRRAKMASSEAMRRQGGTET